MNLLLLLSAILSALTGVGSSTRAPQAPAAVSQLARVQVARAAVTLESHPAAVAPRVIDARELRGSVLSLLPVEPVFATRRRE